MSINLDGVNMRRNNNTLLRCLKKYNYHITDACKQTPGSEITIA